jgi:CRISPR-associated protein Csb1
VNLVALRALGEEKDQTLRRYVLGLALVAAVEPQDNFLRQGCLLTLDPDSPGVWNLVSRDGSRNAAAIGRELVQSYAETAAYEFGVGPSRSIKFDKNLARAAIDEKKGGKTKKSAKKEEADASGG